MPEMTLARTVATVVCGVVLWVSGIQPTVAAEQVKIIKLRGGELRLVNNDEHKPKAVINGKEFLFLPKQVAHKATYRLSDRDVVILTTTDNLSSYTSPEHRFFSVRTDGAVEEIDHPHLRLAARSFVGEKKGDAVYFDLGYYDGLKIDAVLSTKGLQILEKPVIRPAYNSKDCKWLYESAVGECVTRFRPACDLLDYSIGTRFRLDVLVKNPRWKVAEERFDAICEVACKAKKRPAYSQFAKSICGP